MEQEISGSAVIPALGLQNGLSGLSLWVQCKHGPRDLEGNAPTERASSLACFPPSFWVSGNAGRVAEEAADEV